MEERDEAKCVWRVKNLAIGLVGLEWRREYNGCETRRWRLDLGDEGRVADAYMLWFIAGTTDEIWSWVVSIDKSLKRKGRLARSRNVLSRSERILQMIGEDKLGSQDSPFGLPKLRIVKMVIGKKKKKKAAEDKKDDKKKAAKKK